MLPKTSAYVKSYECQTKWMYFFIFIWDKVSATIKNKFDSESVYDKNYFKTKIKSHGHKVTDSYDKKIPKFDFNHTCLAVLAWILLLKRM